MPTYSEESVYWRLLAASQYYVDAAYCYRRSGLSIVCHNRREPCKNGWTDRDALWVVDSCGPKEPLLDGVRIHPMRRGNFEREKGRPIVTYRDSLSWAELNEMPFGMWTRVGPRKHVFDGLHIGTTWQIRLNRPCAVAMQSYVELLWPLACWITDFNLF